MEAEWKERTQNMICYKTRDETGELELDGRKKNEISLPNSLSGLKLLPEQVCIFPQSTVYVSLNL